MRLFLAIDLPVKIKEKISNMIKNLKQEYQDFRWVSENNYHMTIYFFEENCSLNNMEEKIKRAIFDIYPFYLYSSQGQLFIRKKVLLYLGFRKNKELEKMASNIIKTFSPKKKIKFIPHLTLARYRIPSKQQYFVIKKKMKDLDIDLEFKVKKLTLFNCINYNTKPEYKIIKEFELLEK